MGAISKECPFLYKDFIEQEGEFSELYVKLDKYWTEEREEEKVRMNSRVKIDRTIWIFWLQGLEKAPVLVKKCFDSVLRNKPDDFDLVVLTENNLNQYIDLPCYIIEKYKDGKMGVTHLSDIIRVELLYSYGGCWIDATVFCMDKIPRFMFEEMFLFQITSVLTRPVVNISNWWIYARKGNLIISRVRQVLLSFWKNENIIWNYFLFHIIFAKVVNSDEKCKSVFDKIPYYNSGNAHVLYSKLGQNYSEEKWSVIKYISPVQKLSYKKRFIRGDIESNYVHIIS
ncbi:Capsular polysaccharide synthesis protein [Lachnospiraceae bacterium KH1T2]|nr:Capsular polysaccharide synthesis protein [Lachnospiraceae bacterium KH1T2]